MAFAVCAALNLGADPVKLIFDTDMYTDYDASGHWRCCTRLRTRVSVAT